MDITGNGKKLLNASLPHEAVLNILWLYTILLLKLGSVYGMDKKRVGVGALLPDCGGGVRYYA